MHRCPNLLILMTVLISGCTNAQKEQIPTKLDLLIGTYTHNGASEGIYVYTFDTQTGELEYKNKATGIDNPSFLTLSPDLKSVYAVSESGDSPTGMVYSYGYDASTGVLTFKNKESAGGKGSCYVSVDKSGKYVFTANYSGGSLAAIPIMPDGSLGSAIQEIHNKGIMVGENERRSRMHAVVISPNNDYLFAPNLGIDKIGVYHFDANAISNPLKAADPEFVSLPEKSGPRHFVFHPNEKYAYVIQELDGGITAFDYNNGKLTEIQTVSLLPEGFEGKFGAADIHISPDGKFLYGSNRIGLNEIIIYSIDQTNGHLTFVGRESSKGLIPRNFAIDPTGNFLLVANQDTDDIHVFKRDQETGVLTSTDISVKVGRPVCLKFVY